MQSITLTVPVGVSPGLQDERVTPVAAPRAVSARGGGHTPAAVGVFAEQCGEASRRIEAEAQPVHRTVRADQGRCLRVSTIA